MCSVCVWGGGEWVGGVFLCSAPTTLRRKDDKRTSLYALLGSGFAVGHHDLHVTVNRTLSTEATTSIVIVFSFVNAGFRWDLFAQS